MHRPRSYGSPRARRARSFPCPWLAAAPLALAAPAVPAAAPAPQASPPLETLVVRARRAPLVVDQGASVSPFGFEASVLETPRSVTALPDGFMDAFGVEGLHDLVTFVPGTFTTSFFGVAGSLDVRGTPAENYFRGMKRLNNDGNFPTPIGASERVEVLRGPGTALVGAGKIGGALNVIPRSALASSGRWLEAPSGSVTFTGGRWDRYVLDVEAGGPLRLRGRRSGWHAFGSFEDSESFYDHDETEQQLLQAGLVTEWDARTTIETGFMGQRWRGHENGGWNRVTQALIDSGTYLAGRPAVDIDAVGDADGLIEEPDIDAFEARLEGVVGADPFVSGPACFTGLAAFCFEGDVEPVAPSALPPALIAELGLGLDPASVREVTLDPSRVLIAPSDRFDTDALTAYLDVARELGGAASLTARFFYDGTRYEAIDGYGYTKTADSWVVENQWVLAVAGTSGPLAWDLRLAPSLRWTEAFFAEDFTDEVFDRVDLSRGFGVLSLQQSPLRAPETWTYWWTARYLQAGLAGLADLRLGERLRVVAGLRAEHVWITAENGDGDGPVRLRTFDPFGEHVASDEDGGPSGSLSVIWTVLPGLNLYGTAARQYSIVSALAGDVAADNVRNGTWYADGELLEAGAKTERLDGRLFAAVSVYEQERVAFDSQNPVNNRATRARGIEIEARFQATERLLLLGQYTRTRVDVLEPDGVTFTYLGAANLPQVDPALLYGGIVAADVPVPARTPRGGIPEHVAGLAAHVRWTPRLTTAVSWLGVDAVQAGVLPGVTLPAYELVGLDVTWRARRWEAALRLENLTDERYFRANFPGLFGNNVVLPERPFHWEASVTVHL